MNSGPNPPFKVSRAAPDIGPIDHTFSVNGRLATTPILARPTACGWLHEGQRIYLATCDLNHRANHVVAER